MRSESAHVYRHQGEYRSDRFYRAVAASGNTGIHESAIDREEVLTSMHSDETSVRRFAKRL